MLEELWAQIRPMLRHEDVKAARKAFDHAEHALASASAPLTAVAANAAAHRAEARG